MRLRETTLTFLEDDCMRNFGAEKGRLMFRRAEEIYQDLLSHADYQNSDVIKAHLQRKLFPPMAYYKALLEDGIQRDKALALVREETHKAAAVKKADMQKLSSLPFAWFLYRMGVKKHMKKNFPNEGWQTEWIRCDSRVIHFNLRRCIYWDITKQCGCPELCCVYCENDDISFSGLLPKIQFRRSGTLGNGADRCDFHFIKAR